MRFYRNLLRRHPNLGKLTTLGWKTILTETLIEIPFLILESSFWIGILFGFSLTLSFWHYALVAMGLYGSIELGRWLFMRCVRRAKDYQFFQTERDLLRLAWSWIRRAP